MINQQNARLVSIFCIVGGMFGVAGILGTAHSRPVPTVQAAPTVPSVITLPEMTITAMAPAGRRVEGPKARKAVSAKRAEPTLRALEQGGRPGHRLILAWEGARK